MTASRGRGVRPQARDGKPRRDRDDGKPRKGRAPQARDGEPRRDRRRRQAAEGASAASERSPPATRRGPAGRASAATDASRAEAVRPHEPRGRQSDPQRDPVPAPAHRAPRRGATTGSDLEATGAADGQGRGRCRRPRRSASARPRSRRRPRKATTRAVPRRRRRSTEAADELAPASRVGTPTVPRTSSPGRPRRTRRAGNATRPACCDRCATPIPDVAAVRELLGLVQYRLGNYPAATKELIAFARPHAARSSSTRC